MRTPVVFGRIGWRWVEDDDSPSALSAPNSCVWVVPATRLCLSSVAMTFGCLASRWVYPYR